MNMRPLAFALAVTLAACGSGEQAATPAADQAAATPAATPAVDPAATAKQLDALYAEFWEENLKLNPIQATFIGDERYNDQLPNFLSAEFRKQSHDFDQKWLDKISAIDPAGLDSNARTSYDIFVRDRRMSLEGERFPGWMQPVNQFGSFASFAVQLGSGTGAQPFKTVKHYDDWLARGIAPAVDLRHRDRQHARRHEDRRRAAARC